MSAADSSRSQQSLRRQKTLPALNDWDRYQPADRGSWWRCQLTRYPPVGQYSPKETVELQRVAYPSFAFKSSGRRRECGVVAKGDHLLPGAYNHRSFVEELSGDLRSYGFRNSKKSSLDALTEGLVDKKLQNLTPGQYNVESYQSIRADPEPVKASCFKSKTRRTIKEFQPRDGPPPGSYESAGSTLSSRANRASFVSACPRFSSSYSKVPGPGSYSSSYQSPMPANLVQLGKQHGLFFSTAFYP